MKKVVSIFFVLALVFSFCVGFAMNANAAGEDVTVGQVFEKNDMSNNAAAWLSNDKEKDPWVYEFFALKKQVYSLLKYSTSGSIYSFDGTDTQIKGDGIFLYCCVRNRGVNFHPGKGADVVKSFICPVSGTLHVKTEIARTAEADGESKTASSFVVVLSSSNSGKDDQVVYPADGSTMLLTTTQKQTIEFDVPVKAGQYLRFRVGANDGNITACGHNMSNWVSYTEITDDEAIGTFENSDVKHSNKLASDVTLQSNVGDVQEDNSNAKGPDKEKGGFPIWVIILIAVVVVVAVVVVIILVSKKKAVPVDNNASTEDAKNE